MVVRVTGALIRAILVALMVATPSLLLPPQAATTIEIVLLAAILAGSLSYIEYVSVYPSLVEFRDAPPINRIRFASLFVTVFALTVVVNHSIAPTSLSNAVNHLGSVLGLSLDFSFSPVHLAVLMLPAGESPDVIALVRSAAGLAYVISLLTIIAFIVIVRVSGWPVKTGVFNVWINLPLFDPTAGGDVILRLQRDGRINIVLGVLMPFLIPATVKLASVVTGPMVMSSANVLIWTISAWAFLPSSMIIRGIAMLRVAELIENKRRRAHAEAEELQTA